MKIVSQAFVVTADFLKWVGWAGGALTLVVGGAFYLGGEWTRWVEIREADKNAKIVQLLEQKISSLSGRVKDIEETAVCLKKGYHIVYNTNSEYFLAVENSAVPCAGSERPCPVASVGNINAVGSPGNGNFRWEVRE
ncbi:MAG: hypothetical protein AAFR84_12070 [Pseudomonadota bacterium]